MGEWQRVRIGDFLHRAKSPVSLRDDEEYQLVTVRMHHKGVVLREKKKGKLIGSNMYRVKTGQFILSGIDARHGAFGVIPEELDGAIVTNDFWYFDVDDAVVSRDFFLWFTSTPLFLDACIKSSEGTTNRRRLQAERFFNFSFNFPGITEQHRLAERFAAFEGAYSALNNESDLQTSYFKQLRQAVLQEAVEGKMTADWRKQHPVVKGDPQHDAATLLAQIKAEKERLVKVGKIRKAKPLPPIVDSEKPFNVPLDWVWVRFAEVTQSISTGPFGSMLHKSDYVKNGIPLVNPMNMVTNRIVPSEKMMVSQETIKRLERYILNTGDIVVARRGDLSKCAIVDAENDGWLCGTGSFFLKLGQIDKVFFIKYFVSSYAQSYLLRDSIGQTMDNLNQGLLSKLPFPLPPLAEQQAIVARVDSLMATIDSLEAQVTQRKEQAQLLMQAVLREAFAGGEGAKASDFLPLQGGGQEGDGLERRQSLRGRPIPTPALPLKERGRSRKPGGGEVLPLVAEPPAAYKTRGQAALPAANQPVPTRILAAMHPGRDYSRADLLAATGIGEADWTWAIRQLKEQGRVVQQGEKRGARYRPASARETT